VVRGDQSYAEGAIWILDRETEVAIFDIDGTLTTDDGEVFEELLTGGAPEMHRGAVEVAEYWASRDVQPIYLTGRPYMLDGRSRTWLRARGFPEGPVRTTDHMSEALPMGVSAFKQSYLVDLKERVGLRLRAAYGNATTDICAYAEAGIYPASTYSIGEHAGEFCPGHPPTVPVPDYSAHLATLRSSLP
jgi:phosphatidate phosphatase PAH1